MFARLLDVLERAGEKNNHKEIQVVLKFFNKNREKMEILIKKKQSISM